MALVWGPPGDLTKSPAPSLPPSRSTQPRHLRLRAALPPQTMPGAGPLAAHFSKKGRIATNRPIRGTTRRPEDLFVCALVFREPHYYEFLATPASLAAPKLNPNKWRLGPIKTTVQRAPSAQREPRVPSRAHGPHLQPPAASHVGKSTTSLVDFRSATRKSARRGTFGAGGRPGPPGEPVGNDMRRVCAPSMPAARFALKKKRIGRNRPSSRPRCRSSPMSPEVNWARFLRAEQPQESPKRKPPSQAAQAERHFFSLSAWAKVVKMPRRCASAPGRRARSAIFLAPQSRTRRGRTFYCKLEDVAAARGDACPPATP